jgi:hypothetical protein
VLLRYWIEVGLVEDVRGRIDVTLHDVLGVATLSPGYLIEADA